MHICEELSEDRHEDKDNSWSHGLSFLLSYLFCSSAQPGLSTLWPNNNFVEGRPSLLSDLNIVAAILAVRQPPASDVEEFPLL